MSRQTYHECLQNDLGAVIDELKLEELPRRFLRSRWLDQVLWMEGRADHARKWYYTLRLITIMGSVTLPALVSLNVDNTNAKSYVHWLTFALGLLVALSAAIEEFFHYGERWRHYRRTVELLKIEGWQFFSLIGPYQHNKNHVQAYPSFASRVEGIIQPSVEVYITEVAREKEAAHKSGEGGEIAEKELPEGANLPHNASAPLPSTLSKQAQP